MTLTLSHGGPTIFSTRQPSNELLVGTQRGIVRLRREGESWQRAGDALTDRHISAILEVPSQGLLFAGAYEGSLHRSSDGGLTWQRCDHGIAHHDVYSLAARTLADGGIVVYCGTEPAHLYESRDLGESWRELPGVLTAGGTEHWTFPAPPHVAHLKHITFDPRDNNVIYASVEQGGLLKSTDGGAGWRDMDGVDDDVHRVVLSAARPDRLYITGGDGMYVSEDGGETWEHWHSQEAEFGGYPDQLVFRPSNPDEMYIASAQTNPGVWHTNHFAGSRISHSSDGGRSWQTVHDGLPDRLASSVEAMLLEEWEGGFALFAATTAGEVWYSGVNATGWACVISDLAPISKAGHYRLLVPA
jgi:photosystem II stability/assembly factor-like uncharacterized protein